MDAEQPKSRPEPPPGPAVYGGQWGDSGKQNPDDQGTKNTPDRPDKIKTPDEPEGMPSGTTADAPGGDT